MVRMYVETSHWFAKQILMIQVFIETKGILKIISKFILTKKGNIYYMFYYFLISHFSFTQNYVKQQALVFNVQHLVSCNLYSTYTA